jgi:site-specific recombinase XerD
MVYKYLDMSGLESKHYSVHKLRHTAATLMYQTGNVDVRVLKDILGHEQLNTTQIYTHVSNESMEAAMSQNPLSKMRKPKKEEV